MGENSMFRWHYVRYDDGGKLECRATGDLPNGDRVDCFCQLSSADFEFRLLEFTEGEFLDDQCVPRKVFRWCSVNDIVRALNDITRAFMQSEAVKLDKHVD